MLKVTSEQAFETYLEEVLFQKSGWHKLPMDGWDISPNGLRRAFFPCEGRPGILPMACGIIFDRHEIAHRAVEGGQRGGMALLKKEGIV